MLRIPYPDGGSESTGVIEPTTTELLERGCSLILGTVDEDDTPHASRGWGLDVLDAAAGTVRLLLDAADALTARHVGRGGLIAITACDVRTLRSVQLKGRSRDLAAGDAAATARAGRYADAFFGDIVATDGTDPRLPPRLLPRAFATCVVEVTEQFDQTPGPGAGAQLGQP
jgi:hypothetical protein